MINKKVASVGKTLEGIASNMTLMFDGFGLCGIPENRINAISKMKREKLT